MNGVVKLHEPGAIIDQATLIADLKDLEVRRSWPELYGDTTLSLGSHLPTRREWQTQKPEYLGLDIRHAVESGQAALRVFALKDTGILRREEARRRSGAICVKRLWAESPIFGAQITGVVNIAMAGDRALPLLSLTDHSNPGQDYALSLSELAHYVQTEQAEITLV